MAAAWTVEGSPLQYPGGDPVAVAAQKRANVSAKINACAKMIECLSENQGLETLLLRCCCVVVAK